MQPVVLLAFHPAVYEAEKKGEEIEEEQEENICVSLHDMTPNGYLQLVVGDWYLQDGHQRHLGISWSCCSQSQTLLLSLMQSAFLRHRQPSCGGEIEGTKNAARNNRNSLMHG
jgi:hypothetical protein